MRSFLENVEARFFFEPVYLGGQPADLCVQFLELALVGNPWSFLSLIAIAVALTSWLSSDERLARAGGLFALPIGHYYCSVVLIDVAPLWLLVPLSWVSLLIAHKVGDFYPIASLSFVALAWRFTKVKRRCRNRGHSKRD
ncbi:MAG: hypothetical protein GQ524_03095 [Anaerolineales bacterium]|nr:hypothetical protein [Anaerolineales bacterium]